MPFARVIGMCVLAALLSGVPRMGQAQQPPPTTAERPVVPEAPWRRVVQSIALSGFAAMEGAARSVPGDAVTLAAAELDGTVEFGGALQGAVALARDGTQLVLAAGFLDFHLDFHVGGERIAPRGAIFAERGMHLQAGRFDVPFGADWQRFAPPDRGLTSAPAITDLIADGGLNDVGLRAFSVGARWNATAWLVRGALAGRAMGARVALTPFSNPFVFRGPEEERPLELGLSTHVDGRDGRIVDQRAALDVDLRRGGYALAAEWQNRRVVRSVQGLSAGHAQGWHVSAELPVPSPRRFETLVFARWEAMRGDALGTPGLAEATALRGAVAGARMAVGSRALMKGEHGWRLGATDRDVMPARQWLWNLVLTW